MAKYSKEAANKVERSMHEMKEGKLKSGNSDKKVTDRKQAMLSAYPKRVKKALRFQGRPHQKLNESDITGMISF